MSPRRSFLQRFWLKIHLIWVVGFILLPEDSLNKQCKLGSVHGINEKFEEMCYPCGDNCTTCLLMENLKPSCFYCKEGYRLDKSTKDYSCIPCSTGCRRCIGSGMSQCSETMPGFFYSSKSKAIEPCGEGCHRCYSKTECSVCKDGFYSKLPEIKPQSKDDKPSDANSAEKKQLDVGEDIFKQLKSISLDCIPCKIDNCRFCEQQKDEIKSNNILVCSLCEKGFGTVDNRCKPCPENCEYCKQQSQECVHCAIDFQWNSKNSKCEKIKIENCAVVSSEGKCKVCDNLFYLDKELESCLPCKKTLEHCSHCVKKRNNLKCKFCERGFYNASEKSDKDKPSTNKCLKCPDNCNHCNKNECFICNQEFFYDSKKKKCTKCKIKNCDQCVTKSICASCNAGFRFDKKKKKCVLCDGDCLRCSSEGHCYECPVDHFVLLHEKINKKNGQNILSSLLGMFLGSVGMGLPNLPITTIEFRSECLKECPSELDGQKVIVNYAERKCVVKTTDKTQQMPLLSLPSFSHSGSFYNEIDKLKLHYIQEINKIKQASLSKKPTKEDAVSEECFNNGLIKKIFRGNLSSYYICRCLPGFLGDNCQITQELHGMIQQKLLELLENIQQQLPTLTKHRYKEIMNTLISFNKFKIDEGVISKIMEVLGFLLDRNHTLDNKKRLYVLYDSLLLSIFDQMEDIKKKGQNETLVDYDSKQEEILFEEKIRKVVLFIEASLEDIDYAHSFLKSGKKEYVGLQTYAFIISESQLSSNCFIVPNPNIDSSFNTQSNTKVELISSEEDNHLNSKFNLQFINFSIELFQFNFTNYELISNVLYLKFIDSFNPHIQVNNKNVLLRSVRLMVPLLTLPGFMDIKSHVYCLSFKTEDYVVGKHVAVVESFDEDSQFITCLFENVTSFTNTYFGVFIKKREDKD